MMIYNKDNLTNRENITYPKYALNKKYTVSTIHQAILEKI